MTPDENNIEEVLEHALPSASQEQREAARDRIYNRARSGKAEVPEDSMADFSSARFDWNRVVRLAAAAVLVAAAIWVGLSRQSDTVYAVLETTDGSVYRVVEGNAVPLRAQDRIGAREIVRSNGGGGGGVLRLGDGSNIEMRSKSELSLERADDGIRIHLRSGVLIVKAAKQVAGHLYVQTKDVTVSVVGTVFLVNAEEEGSRVSVIEGEVRVQQGTTTKNLHPGEQLATSPKLETLAVKDELSWSRNAVAHVALLEQSAVVSPPPRLAFEEVSVRQHRPAAPPPGQRTGGDKRCEGNIKIDPSRFAATNISVYHLLLLAYSPWTVRSGGDCLTVMTLNLLSAEPAWTKSDLFDIQALLPAGSPSYTEAQLRNGEAPELQMMLQTLLATRFQLVLRHDTREMPVYLLTVDTSGLKFITPRDLSKVIIRAASDAALIWGIGLDASGDILTQWNVRRQPMTAVASSLAFETRRPVVDRTGLTGTFDFDLKYASDNSDPSDPLGLTPVNPKTGKPFRYATSPSIFAALKEQGLKLESGNAPIEVLVIERVERPTEN